MASELVNELASAAAEAETLNAEPFVYDGRTYLGVVGDAPISMTLTNPGYTETAQQVLAASLGQFIAVNTVPTPADAAARKIITLRAREWKIVALENDGLHVRFGLVLVT